MIKIVRIGNSSKSLLDIASGKFKYKHIYETESLYTKVTQEPVVVK